MKWFFLCIMLITNCSLIIGQEYDYKNYKWEEKPSIHDLTENEAKESYIVMKDKRVMEYIYDEQQNLVIFETHHQIIRLNDDRAIESYNKVYVSLKDVMETIAIKARAISSDNKVVDVPQDNILEMEVGDYGTYKIFAFEGLEKGMEVEYFYTLKKYVSYYDREFFQKDAIVKNASFHLISPENLIFISKSYNSFPELIDTTINEKNYLSAEVEKILARDKEQYAVYIPNLMRVEYKFSHNNLVRDTEVLTWADGAKKFFESINNVDPKALKKVAKLVATLKLKDLEEDKKIRAIDNYVKNNILVREDVPSSMETLLNILKNKYTSPKGIVRLYVAMLDESGIEHQLVLTTDRFNNVKFDGDFMSWNYLKYYLLYFPGTDKFLAPTKTEYRYPLIPHEWAHNDGLFIKAVTIGDFKTGIAEVNFIPIAEYDKSYNNMDITIDFSKGFDDLNVNLKYSFGGHLAMFLQPVYTYLSDEDKETAVKAIMQSISDDIKIVEKSVSNYNIDQSPYIEPFIIEGSITTNTLLEKAGSDYLFKIGNVIGRQVEMYQETKRQNSVELEHPHSYIRNITFDIPEGYEVKDLDKLKMDISYGEGDEKEMLFISDYVIEDNLVKVKLDEYYKTPTYPIELYENFRKVINAAADFNKIVLVLEKQ